MKIISEELNLISIKNFHRINFFERMKVNSILERNKCYLSDLGYNYAIYEEQTSFFSNVKTKFITQSKNIFGNFTISARYNNTCWCYRSKGDQYDSIYHDHLDTSTINSVYYHQICKGDSISFLNSKDEELIYYPDQNELLIFPNHVRHKPNKPVGNRIRYSINMEILTQETSDQLFNYGLH